MIIWKTSKWLLDSTFFYVKEEAWRINHTNICYKAVAMKVQKVEIKVATCGNHPAKQNAIYSTTYLSFSWQHVICELGDRLFRDVCGFRFKLGHILSHLDDTEDGKIFISDREKLHDTLVVLLIGINENEKNL